MDKEKDVPSSLELLRRIRQEISDASPWPERFSRLAQAIIVTSPTNTELGTITCQQCQGSLDLLVTDDLAGSISLRQHLTLLAHLTECTSCRTAYILLRDMLLADEEVLKTVADSPTRQNDWLSALTPLTLQVASDFINNALQGPQLAAVRGTSVPEGRHKALAYIDALLTEQEDLIVEISVLRHVEQPDTIDLDIELISNFPLPSGLRAYLSWNTIQRSTPIKKGKARFSNIPCSALLQERDDEIQVDLTITIE